MRRDADRGRYFEGKFSSRAAARAFPTSSQRQRSWGRPPGPGRPCGQPRPRPRARSLPPRRRRPSAAVPERYRAAPPGPPRPAGATRRRPPGASSRRRRGSSRSSSGARGHGDQEAAGGRRRRRSVGQKSASRFRLYRRRRTKPAAPGRRTRSCNYSTFRLLHVGGRAGWALSELSLRTPYRAERRSVRRRQTLCISPARLSEASPL